MTHTTPLPPLVDNYLQFLLVVRGLSENSLEAYSRDLQDFCTFLAKHSADITKVTPQTLSVYLFHLRHKGLSAKTVARYLSSLRGLFTYLAEQNLLAENPARYLENPKLPQSLPEVLSHKEVGILLEQPDTNTLLGMRDRTMLELLYAAGLRVSELTAMQPFDFDPQRGIVRVIGKGDKERLVPVHYIAQDFLQEYLSHWRPRFRPKENVVFLNRSGKGISRQGVWKALKRHVQAAGITRKVSPHSLRHCFATHLLAGGADLRTVQILLGHADIAATEIYTHVDATRLTRIHKEHHPRSALFVKE